MSTMAGCFTTLAFRDPLAQRWTPGVSVDSEFATSEGGVNFKERITQYDTLHAVSFDIQVDPNSVGDKIFDQHGAQRQLFSICQCNLPADGHTTWKDFARIDVNLSAHFKN